jgi:pimeloyl-ACP methyl ester carboxylesterase
MADPTIVLVHGAFADASGFRGLYDDLLGHDVTVVAPPNPLRGLSGGDGDYLKARIAEIEGPVLLVGHSYGGSVITAAGTADNVVGLVYLSGFAPDEGENLTDLQSKFPAPGIIPYIVEHQLPEAGNEFTLAPAGFHESFCADIPADEAAFYASSQRPLAGVALTESAPTPAWRSRPVWAVLPTADRCCGSVCRAAGSSSAAPRSGHGSRRPAAPRPRAARAWSSSSRPKRRASRSRSNRMTRSRGGG